MVQKLTLLENSACHLSASGFQFLFSVSRSGRVGVNIRSPTAPTSSFTSHFIISRSRRLSARGPLSRWRTRQS